MQMVNKKILRILKLSLGINQSYISDTTNLINEFNLCDWELELLYSKIELAFNIELKHPVPKDEICIGKLQKEITENIYKKNV
jgi:hypothetical protein